MNKMNSYIVGLDYDGTCVTHAYPKVGEDIGAVKVLKRILENGHKIILFTMRSDINHLGDALDWFSANDIELWGINKNNTQFVWTNSPKPHCNIFIDDAALGTPLKYDVNLSDSPFVDWEKVEEMLVNMGILVI